MVLRGSKHRAEVNIKVGLKQTGWDALDWVWVIQNMSIAKLSWPSALHGIENVIVLQLVRKFISFSWIWMFITAFTAARQLSLEPHQIQTPASCLLESILILSCSYAWVFKVVLPSGFLTKALCLPFVSPYVLHVSPTRLCLISDLSLTQ